jgi:hypothetical protein
VATERSSVGCRGDNVRDCSLSLSQRTLYDCEYVLYNFVLSVNVLLCSHHSSIHILIYCSKVLQRKTSSDILILLLIESCSNSS